MRYWLVTLDSQRLRTTFSQRHWQQISAALLAAAHQARVHVLASCLVRHGPRVIVRSATRSCLRVFARRAVALLTAQNVAIAWRTGISVCRLNEKSIASHVQRFAAWQKVHLKGEGTMRRVKPGSRAAVRVAARFLKIIIAFNSALLGSDESASRLRRYVASHELPDDDRLAFSRLCDLILSQKIGPAAVEQERRALNAAFSDFEPSAVATLEMQQIARRLSSTTLRDPKKIQTCIAAGKSWCRAAGGGRYMARVVRIASEDDALLGWPKLMAAIVEEFTGIGQLMAAALLKRWGFFSAAAHPGVRRLLARLGVIDRDADARAVQAFLVRIADASTLTPSAVEGTMAIFAGSGPCRDQPRCEDCPLSSRCPSSSIADIADAPRAS